MKRCFWYMLILTAFVFLLVGCQTVTSTVETTTEPPVTTTSPLTEALEIPFDEVFEANRMTDNMKQYEFFDLLRQCSYYGEPISDLAGFATWDGEIGSGDLLTVSDVLYAESSQTRDVSKEYADQTNRVKLLASVDGLVLPYGLEFGSSLDALLTKLGFSTDVLDQLADAETDTVILTSRTDGETTVTVVLVTTSEDGVTTAVYELIYTECDAMHSDENTINSRSVTMEYRESSGLNSVTYLLNCRTLTSFDSAVCMDTIGLYAEMSEEAFINLYRSYTYQGESIEKHPDFDSGWPIDDLNGGGTTFSTPNVIAGESTYRTFDDESGSYAISRKEFVFFAPIDQMPKPYGITFGTTLADALIASGITLDYENDFTPSEDDPHLMVLKRETYGVILTQWNLIDRGSPEGEQDTSPRYQLQYVRTYSTTGVNGKKKTETRCVEIGFDRQNTAASYISYLIEARFESAE